MKKILLIDDHDVVRSGIKNVLKDRYSHVEIHEACDGDTAVEKIKSNIYDFILMDIHMPKTDTLALLEFILVKDRDAKVLIFSMAAENMYAKRFLKAGAKGFISKEAYVTDIIKAIDIVLNGRMYISENLSQALALASFSSEPDNPFNKLTEREFEIAMLLLSGQTITEITKSLNLQPSTVGTHKSRLFEKLGISNILELSELDRSYNKVDKLNPGSE